jgi:NAD(P)-dependent dehydrogenase (short-subunit alcohol dehydrogenase family)
MYVPREMRVPLCETQQADCRVQGIAMSFAKAGARVLILAGRKKRDLEAAAAEMHAIAPAIQVDVRVLDISDETSVKNAFIGLQGTYDKIDVLVNNAGSGDSPLPIIEVEAAEWWCNFVRINLGQHHFLWALIKLSRRSWSKAPSS